MQTLDYLQEVRQGNPALLAGLFEKALASQQISVGGQREADELHLLFKSNQPLDPELVRTYVRSAFQALNLPPRVVHLYGHSAEQKSPSWQRRLQWPADASPEQTGGLKDAPPDLDGAPEAEAAAVGSSLNSPGVLLPLREPATEEQRVTSEAEAIALHRPRPRFPRRSGLLLGVGLLGVGLLAVSAYWEWRERTGMAPAASPVSTGASQTAPAAEVSPGQLQKARLAGWRAALAAQKAKTADEWGQVASLWQTAIAQMTAIPPQSAEGKAAQAKILDYQQKRAIALRRQQQAALSQ